MCSLVCNTFTVRILREHSREMRILNRRLARQNVFQTTFLESWMIRASWAIVEDEKKITATQNCASRHKIKSTICTHYLVTTRSFTMRTGSCDLLETLLHMVSASKNDKDDLDNNKQWDSSQCGPGSFDRLPASSHVWPR